jgi:hypothetical protein
MVSSEQCVQIAAPIRRCFGLARSIDLRLPGAEQSSEQAIGGVTTSLIGPNQFVRRRAQHFGIHQYLTSKITAFDSPSYFQDTLYGTLSHAS